LFEKNLDIGLKKRMIGANYRTAAVLMRKIGLLRFVMFEKIK